MRERLLELWCDVLEIDIEDWERIKCDGEIEIDSLLIIKFVVSVEDEFGVELDDKTLLLGQEDIIDEVSKELLSIKNDE